MMWSRPCRALVRPKGRRLRHAAVSLGKVPADAADRSWPGGDTPGSKTVTGPGEPA